MRVVSVAEMRAIEAATFAAGVPEHELQDRAGRAVAEAIAGLRPPGEAVALIGPGNNGRDAYLAVLRLLERGWTGGLYLTPRHAVGERELLAFASAGGRVTWHLEGMTAAAVETTLAHVTVAIDGLLGIGATGEARPPLAEIIEAINAYRRRRPQLLVASVDNPSGVDPDTGRATGVAVMADVTVVLGGAKRGLLTPEAARYVGQLVFADIGVLDGPADASELVTAASVGGLLEPPHPAAHKGKLGRILVVAGSERYVGAAYLVCAAAARAGAGLVSLAAPRWLRDVVAARLPEVTYLPLPDGGPARNADECSAIVMDALPSCQALALGPGLSTEGTVGDFVEAVLKNRAAIGTPAVIDADGLNALATRPEWPRWIGGNTVLTPHLGELRRLTSVDEAAAPWETARRLTGDWPVTLVIKGPFTAIGRGASTWVHARPNPALATAGTGDVLTGLIGGLLARGVGPAEAARLGVWAHGEAAARVSRGRNAGLLASDLLPEIAGALAEAARPVASTSP